MREEQSTLIHAHTPTDGRSRLAADLLGRAAAGLFVGVFVVAVMYFTRLPNVQLRVYGDPGEGFDYTLNLGAEVVLVPVAFAILHSVAYAFGAILSHQGFRFPSWFTVLGPLASSIVVCVYLLFVPQYYEAVPVGYPVHYPDLPGGYIAVASVGIGLAVGLLRWRMRERGDVGGRQRLPER
ncbi:hypothetical protein GIY30_09755 [Gordonia sp. HNM0687]|uniref:Uncharacterized protein n=1 Tax=Gordonia mangrovi TaxID=2665643 RepID=A0A6L7GR17_9ACTN|nr:hypothetical protein [Gordonia mangrovi]MXP21631.1 hypothetical protein [Gordonia mangrovi]UVF80371.1 hypothetical protein NWF22_11350 [Gordonia mangrovi]